MNRFEAMPMLPAVTEAGSLLAALQDSSMAIWSAKDSRWLHWGHLQAGSFQTLS